MFYMRAPGTRSKECERVSNAFHMQLQHKTVSRLPAS